MNIDRVFEIQNKILKNKYDDREELIVDISSYLQLLEGLNLEDIEKEVIKSLFDNNTKIVEKAVKNKKEVLKKIKQINLKSKYE